MPDVPILLLTGMRVDRKGPPGVHILEEAGRRGGLIAIEGWLKKVPQAEHVMTHKSGHNIPTEEPELVVDAVRRVIDRAGRPRHGP